MLHDISVFGDDTSSLPEKTSDTTSTTTSSRSMSPFADVDDNSDEESDNTSPRATPSTGKDMNEFRRNLVKHLQEKKDSKLMKRNSTELQLVDTAKMDVALKKKGIEMMEEADKKHEQSVKRFEESINHLTSVIANGFNMLQQTMVPQPFVVPQQQQFYQYQHHKSNEHVGVAVSGMEQYPVQGKPFEYFNGDH